MILNHDNWVVVSIMFSVHHRSLREMIPLYEDIFLEMGLKPPTMRFFFWFGLRTLPTVGGVFGGLDFFGCKVSQPHLFSP